MQPSSLYNRTKLEKVIEDAAQAVVHKSNPWIPHRRVINLPR